MGEKTEATFQLSHCVITPQGDGQEKAWGREEGTSFALEELVTSCSLECVCLLLSFTFETQRVLSGTLAGQ